MIDREYPESKRQRFNIRHLVPLALRAQDKNVRIGLNCKFFAIIIIYIYF